MPDFPRSVIRDNWEKHGEQISVLDFGAKCDGVTDDGPAFQAAYDDAVDRGGRMVTIPAAKPGAYYRIATGLVFTSDKPVQFRGQGRASKLVRDISLSGSGLFDLRNAKNISFVDFLVDGAVTVSAGVLYSAFSGNPVHTILTDNSSFWLKGAEGILFEGVHIEHTGGYAILLDARTLNVKSVSIKKCSFRNNRPHLFGTSSGDLSYGSWTGGILCQNQATGGSTTHVSDLIVEGNRFERNTGNCVWQHGYGFDSLHQRIKVDNNTFLDCGLDGILFGNVIGGSAIGNTFRRIGYVCVDDSSPSVPKWLAGLNATALDTSGDVRNVPYANNIFVSINGGCINGDGYGLATISGNSMRVPVVGDLEYTEDSIASSGPDHAGANWCQGIILGNSQNRDGGRGVLVTGNQMDNLGGCNIGLYAGRQSTAIGNTLFVPAAANQVPIMVGGFGASSNMNATGNVVTRNVIHYAPVSAAPCVAEDGSLRAFVVGDVNHVVGNYCVGANSFEFSKDANSGSRTIETFTTSATVTAASQHAIQREGSSVSSDSALKFYFRDGATAYGHMQLQGYRGVGVRDPLLNVSDPTILSGLSGVISTGPHTTFGVSHAMVTGHLVGSGFLALTDTAFDDANADVFPNTYALLRWDSTLSRWRQSVSTSSGARVWSDFSSSATAAGADTEVQFNDGGALAGDPSLVWNKTSNLLSIFTAPGTPGLAVGNGYIQAAEGFLAPALTAPNYNAIQAPGGGFYGVSCSVSGYGLWESEPAPVPTTGGTFLNSGVIHYDHGSTVFRFRYGTGASTLVDAFCLAAGYSASSTATNAVDVPSGGASAKWLIATDSLFFIELGSAPAISASGQARIYADAATHTLRASFNGGAYAALGGSGSVAGADSQVQYNNGGAFGAQANFTWDDVNHLLTVTTGSGTPGIAVGGGYIQAEQGFLAPGASATNYNAIQAPGGGVYARALALDDYAVFGDKSSVSALTGGSFGSKSVLWRDSATGRLRLTSGSGTTDGGMQAGAFYCSGTAQDSISVPGGGVQGLSWTSVRNDADAGVVLRRTTTTAREWGMSVTASGEFLLTDRSSGAATLYSLPTASSAASIVYTPGYFQSVIGFLSTGSSYQTVNVGSGGSYARSHRATTYTQIGQSFGAPSATSGDSLVDGCIYYDTSSNTVKARISGSFSDLLTSAGSQAQYVATNTGSSITFKNNNNNFQVDGNGNVSAVAVITSTGAGGGVNVTGQTAQNSIQTVGGFNAGSGGSGNGVYQVFGTTVINSSRQFVGAGAVMTAGCAATGFNINGGGSGQTWNISISGSQFVISGIGSFNNLIFQGGILVSAS